MVQREWNIIMVQREWNVIMVQIEWTVLRDWMVQVEWNGIMALDIATHNNTHHKLFLPPFNKYHIWEDFLLLGICPWKIHIALED